MGCLNSIFKMWPGKSGEKYVGKGREGSFQVNSILRALLAARTIPSSEDCWYGLGIGWVMGREDVSDEMGGVTIGKVLAFGGVEVQLQSLD